MINKIQNKLKKILDGRVELVRQFQQTHLNYNQLIQLFKEDSFIPFTYSSLSPDVILHILNDISVNKKKNIMEFGSGVSTLYIAKLLKTLNLDDVNFFTVESNNEWGQDLHKQLELHSLENKVKIIYAPIIEVSPIFSYLNQRTWYDSEKILETVDNNLKFDIIIVDGPIGARSPYARYSAIPFLKNKLASEFSIFLDDTRRPEEMEIAEEWKKLLMCDLVKFKRYSVLSNSKKFVSLPYQLEV